MKKLLSVFLALLVLTCALPLTASAAETVTINVYNWGQYISDGTDGYLDVNAAFTAATGIQVNYMTYDTNESLYTKLMTGGSTYDIIIPSDYMVARLIEEDMLEELTFDNIPNYQYVDDVYKNTDFDPENKYSVPYTWGTVGVIYNTKYVDEADIGSWDLLWNEKYAGKILMFSNPRDAFAIAESMLGISYNSDNPDELRWAADKLKEQKPLVQQYVMDQIFDSMTNEEAWIAPYYAGDYLYMLEDNPDLGFYFPSEGFNFFVDALCIPKGCQNKEAAEAYINFLCSPEISGQNLDYLGYSTPISAAKEYMDESMASSPVAYPDAETLSRSTSFLNLPEDILQLMDSLWLDVRTAGTDSTSVAVQAATLIVIFGGLAICLLVNNYRKNKRKARRCGRGR